MNGERSEVVDTFRAFRQLERLLFHGVPEHPEPNWERETYAHAGARHTGKSQLTNDFAATSDEEDRLVITVHYVPDWGTAESTDEEKHHGRS